MKRHFHSSLKEADSPGAAKDFACLSERVRASLLPRVLQTCDWAVSEADNQKIVDAVCLVVAPHRVLAQSKAPAH
jgi:hypothetical protein